MKASASRPAEISAMGKPLKHSGQSALSEPVSYTHLTLPTTRMV